MYLHDACSALITPAVLRVGAFDEDEVRQVLKLPQHVRPVAILCVGKGTPPGHYTERMSIAEHVHEDVW